MDRMKNDWVAIYEWILYINSWGTFAQGFLVILSTVIFSATILGVIVLFKPLLSKTPAIESISLIVFIMAIAYSVRFFRRLRFL